MTGGHVRPALRNGGSVGVRWRHVRRDSTSVLTLGMRRPASTASGRVRARSEANCETHLSLRDFGE